MLARILAAVDLEARITVKDYESPIPYWMRRMPALLTTLALLGANEHRTKRAGLRGLRCARRRGGVRVSLGAPSWRWSSSLSLDGALAGTTEARWSTGSVAAQMMPQDDEEALDR